MHRFRDINEMTDEQVERERTRIDKAWSFVDCVRGNNMNHMIESLPEYKDELLDIQKRLTQIQADVTARTDECYDRCPPPWFQNRQ